MSDANKAVVKQAFDAINKGEVAALTKTLDPKLHKAFEAALHAAKSGFKDMKLHIDDMIAEGDKVVTRWTMQGAHKGEAAFGHMGTVKPTNKSLRVSGITIHQIHQGKVINTWGTTDELGGLRQLGLVEHYAKAISAQR
jgi:predicted ester cyclase